MLRNLFLDRGVLLLFVNKANKGIGVSFFGGKGGKERKGEKIKQPVNVVHSIINTGILQNYIINIQCV